MNVKIIDEERSLTAYKVFEETPQAGDAILWDDVLVGVVLRVFVPTDHGVDIHLHVKRLIKDPRK